jgi:hypothetical protein
MLLLAVETVLYIGLTFKCDLKFAVLRKRQSYMKSAPSSLYYLNKDEKDVSTKI